MEKKLEKVLELKIGNIHNKIIAVLLVLVLLSNLHYATNFFSKPTLPIDSQLVSDFSRKVKDTEDRNIELMFDRVRLIGSQNILLAIQDFYFQKNRLPDSLLSLIAEGFMEPTMSLDDPETNHPYFYENRISDFVLCIQLSDEIRGVNTSSCPVLGTEPITNTTEQAGQSIDELDEANKSSSKLEIVGDEPFINIRKEPTTDSIIVATVKPSETFEFSEIRDHWYKVSVREGIEDWIYGDYVEVVSS